MHCAPAVEGEWRNDAWSKVRILRLSSGAVPCQLKAGVAVLPQNVLARVPRRCRLRQIHTWRIRVHHASVPEAAYERERCFEFLRFDVLGEFAAVVPPIIRNPKDTHEP